MIPYHQWNPLTLEVLRAVMANAPFNWCLAGGYAIELFVGERYRPHGDIDVAFFRDDQLAAQRHLAGWNLYAADPPGTLRPWIERERLPEHVHDIWGHRSGSTDWELQLMFQDAAVGRWVYRRDPRVSGPLEEFVEEYRGWPCIRAEIQLLYKSKSIRPHDEEDFSRCVPLFDYGRKNRLAQLLKSVYPEGHPWLRRLEAAAGH